MNIIEKLNLEFEEGKQSESCFSFRATIENVYNVITETITQLEEIKAGGHFDKIDIEIRQEGQAVLDILKQTKDDLDAHGDLLLWRQPKEVGMKK